jgi:uncharacterized protein DUF6916
MMTSNQLSPKKSLSHTIDRRAFMTRGLIPAAAMCTLNHWNSSLFADEIDIAKLTPATFQPLVGKLFKIGGSTDAFVLEKVSVHTPKQKAALPPNVREEIFSLIFSAPEGTQLPAEIQTVSNAKLGSISVYIHEIVPMSSFSNGNLLGHTERLAGMVSQNLLPTPAKAYFEVPFN